MTHIHPDGYLAIPYTGKGRPVLVLHAWWGLNDTIRQFCTRLAEHGFVTFAPDLYQGKVTDTIVGAEDLSMQSMNTRQGCELILTKFLNDRLPRRDRGNRGDRLLAGRVLCAGTIGR